MVFTHPTRREREQRQPKEQVQICPENAAAYPVGHVQEMMMVIPVDPDVNEAHHITQEEWKQGLEHCETGATRHLDLENHDCNDDGENAVAERFHPIPVHDGSL